jgi:hypothetical protein
MGRWGVGYLRDLAARRAAVITGFYTQESDVLTTLKTSRLLGCRDKGVRCRGVSGE